MRAIDGVQILCVVFSQLWGQALTCLYAVNGCESHKDLYLLSTAEPSRKKGEMGSNE